ncbi:hypothetical protein ACIRD3_12040 [Kitasatospora sp. NPDC093550]|uniref:hypothetical protein n=1 Tax=Kitasatospora sp. NPDC093550 TaxID=3364089 RepID=UPI0037FC6B58
MLAGDPDAPARIAAVRAVVEDNPEENPVVTAQRGRAQALLDGDTGRLPALAAAFEAAGSPYQAARTLLLAGDGHRTAGRAARADLGLAPAPATRRRA